MVNMNRISVRYAAMFSAIAIIFVISATLNFTLISEMKERLISLGSHFNTAISAVINAVRDLYQAEVDELKMLGVDNAALRVQHIILLLYLTPSNSTQCKTKSCFAIC